MARVDGFDRAPAEAQPGERAQVVDQRHDHRELVGRQRFPSDEDDGRGVFDLHDGQQCPSGQRGRDAAVCVAQRDVVVAVQIVEQVHGVDHADHADERRAVVLFGERPDHVGRHRLVGQLDDGSRARVGPQGEHGGFVRRVG